MRKIDYYNKLVKDYLAVSGFGTQKKVIDYVLEQSNISNAIKISVLSRNKDNKMHNHQSRISKISKSEFINNLIGVKRKITNAKDFDELFDIIKTNRPKGAGELITYDVALSIGYYLKLYPEKVYVHAGAKKGLENILNRKYHGDRINKNELPEPFCSCNLDCILLEDFLCHHSKGI